MIRAQIRDVENFRAVIENANTIIRLAANHRPAGAGSEIAAADARLPCERVAQRRLGMQLQVIFTEDRN